MRRRRHDPKRMATWLARRERRGWTWLELSQRSGVPVTTLRWWGGRLKQSPVPRSRRRRRFVRVRMVDPPVPALTSLEVETPGGYRLRVPVEFDSEHLRRVLAVVAGC